MTHEPPPDPLTRRRPGHQRRIAYRQRFMGALIAVLLLMVLLVHLPIHDAPERVGWLAQPVPEERIRLQVPPREAADQAERRAPQDAPPVTTFAEEDTHPDGEDEQTTRERNREERTSEAGGEPISFTRLLARDLTLRAQNRLPEVKGGMGRLYLGIDYPERARRKGIEGQLVLEFVVERDGSTSHIQVIQSLHPLCDSSAVAALAHTQFVPGRWNGEPVRVRMRLPVRFRLIGVPASISDARPASVN